LARAKVVHPKVKANARAMVFVISVLLFRVGAVFVPRAARPHERENTYPQE